MSTLYMSAERDRTQDCGFFPALPGRPSATSLVTQPPAEVGTMAEQGNHTKPAEIQANGSLAP